jgi:type VII secretion integral membrane protein EccD
MAIAVVDACRVSVHGAERGRIDLVVPSTTTVAQLLPLLVQRLAPDDVDDDVQDPSWALQRLGGPPMDLDGTPASLDWLDGEHLYLAPTSRALPELDFDDVADGMATMLNRRPDRWNERVQGYALVVAAFTAVAVALVLLLRLPGSWDRVVTALLAGVAGCVAAPVLARGRGDHLVAAGSAMAGSLMLGAGVELAAGGRIAHGLGVANLWSLVAVAASTAVLLGIRSLVSPGLPMTPLAVLGALTALSAVELALVCLRHVDAVVLGGVTVVVLVSLLIWAPRVATRMARLRGPQLPRATEELHVDIDPFAAVDAERRTGHADSRLTVLVVVASVQLVLMACLLTAHPTWATRVLVGLLGVLLLLRTREHGNAIQRTTLIFAGGALVVMPVMSLVQGLPALGAPAAAALLCAAVLLVVGARRPPDRRALPIWLHLGHVLETLSAMAIVPVVLQVVGVLAWARGLAQ